ncbi:C40 family peptidase [Intrasporangium sp. YIM S08009]|uniref:C40 family peptidase n=1 Tax=Intrasporangium zincisolvens TaxID=3080018 RepID=UPI002B0525E9|nr:NlpC/P60 family protein [Intrasporangium sp. YIM S08009]
MPAIARTPARQPRSRLGAGLLLAPLLAVGALGAVAASPPTPAGHLDTSAREADTATWANASDAAQDRDRVDVRLSLASTAAVPLGTRAVRVAAAQKGKPYRWGAAGPTAFDCSGLVHYVYDARLAQDLPRTANAQRLDTTRVSRSGVRPGDLIFFMRSGKAYHVGIYAGSGKVWHAPKPGKRVELVRIWTSGWVAGRVR